MYNKSMMNWTHENLIELHQWTHQRQVIICIGGRNPCTCSKTDLIRERKREEPNIRSVWNLHLSFVWIIYIKICFFSIYTYINYRYYCFPLISYVCALFVCVCVWYVLMHVCVCTYRHMNTEARVRSLPQSISNLYMETWSLG